MFYSQTKNTHSRFQGLKTRAVNSAPWQLCHKHLKFRASFNKLNIHRFQLLRCDALLLFFVLYEGILNMLEFSALSKFMVINSGISPSMFCVYRCRRSASSTSRLNVSLLKKRPAGSARRKQATGNFVSLSVGRLIFKCLSLGCHQNPH